MIKINQNDPNVIEKRSAEEKLKELNHERRQVEKQLETLRAKYQELASLRKEDRLEIEANSLLAGTPIEEVSTVEISEQIKAAQHKFDILTAAVEKQRSIVARAHGNFSRNVCAANRETYIKIAKRIACAVAELAEANELERRFFEELKEAGVSISFRPVRVNAVGSMSDSQSGATFHRREIEKFVPEALQ